MFLVLDEEVVLLEVVERVVVVVTLPVVAQIEESHVLVVDLEVATTLEQFETLLSLLPDARQFPLGLALCHRERLRPRVFQSPGHVQLLFFHYLILTIL